MAFHPENMEKVSDSDVPTEQWYHVAIKTVTEAPSKTTGRNQATIVMAVQEEPYTGTRLITWISLEPHDLRTIKKWYKACRYTPGPEGHDPEQLVGRELYVKPTAQKNPVEGVPPYQIAEWNIAPLDEGKPLK